MTEAVKRGVWIGHPLNRTPFKSIQPAPCDITWFQAGLTRMLGVDAQTGRPWLRIIWAQDQGSDEWGPIAKDWNDYGNGGHGEWRARYLYSATPRRITLIDPETGLSRQKEVWDDIPPPRFQLERLIPPSVACLDWDTPTSRDAWIHRELTGEYIDQDGDRYSPRKPAGGYYVPLELDHPYRLTGGLIADHHSKCCENAKKEDAICYGWYAEPGQEHLVILEQSVAAIKKKKERRPGIITPEEQAEVIKRSRAGREKYWGALEGRLSRITLDALRTHAGLLSPDPTRQTWGKYVFTGGHSKSGATVQQIEQWRKEKAHGSDGSSSGG